MLRSLSVGDPVVSWRGYDLDTPRDQGKVARVTKTQVITTRRGRWDRSNGWLIGDRGYRIDLLYSADDERILVAEARAVEIRAREARADDLTLRVRLWASDPSRENTVRLREAIDRMGPLLGV